MYTLYLYPRGIGYFLRAAMIVAQLVYEVLRDLRDGTEPVLDRLRDFAMAQRPLEIEKAVEARA